MNSSIADILSKGLMLGQVPGRPSEVSGTGADEKSSVSEFSRTLQALQLSAEVPVARLEEGDPTLGAAELESLLELAEASSDDSTALLESVTASLAVLIASVLPSPAPKQSVPAATPPQDMVEAVPPQQTDAAMLDDASLASLASPAARATAGAQAVPADTTAIPMAEAAIAGSGSSETAAQDAPRRPVSGSEPPGQNKANVSYSANAALIADDALRGGATERVELRQVEAAYSPSPLAAKAVPAAQAGAEFLVDVVRTAGPGNDPAAIRTRAAVGMAASVVGQAAADARALEEFAQQTRPWPASVQTGSGDVEDVTGETPPRAFTAIHPVHGSHAGHPTLRQAEMVTPTQTMPEPGVSLTLDSPGEVVEASTPRETISPRGELAASIGNPGTTTSAAAFATGTNAPSAVAQMQAAMGSAQWAGELGEQLVAITMRGEQQVALHLNPRELGPLVVELAMVNNQAQLQFISSQQAVRTAVEAALPELREHLAEQGITLGDTNVSRDSQREASQEQRNESAARARVTDSPASAVPESVTTLPATDRAPKAPGSVNLYV